MSTHPVDVPVELTSTADELLAAAAAGGRSGRTICHLPTLRATLIALTAGNRLEEHESPPAATLQVLRGEVRLQTSDHEWSLSAGQLIVIPPERHSLQAETDTVVLLTVQRD